MHINYLINLFIFRHILIEGYKYADLLYLFISIILFAKFHFRPTNYLESFLIKNK